MRRVSMLAASFLMVAAIGWGCAGSDGSAVTNNANGDPCQDGDEDGYLGLTSQCQKGSDCNDSDPKINPGADEVCGDGIDNDCTQGDEACEQTCQDADGDQYGQGPGCFGMDCDDDNPDVHANAEEICGNGVDENCSGNDAQCPMDCTDQDGDGFGTAQANADCPNDGVDCDDSVQAVHPGAEEQCNDVDDNCNDQVDECDQANATCSGTSSNDRCVLAVGAACSSDAECGDEARCDSDLSECRLADGGSCSGDDQCLKGYSCEDGSCSGDFCTTTTCSGDYPFCDSDAERCVECPHWDSNANYGDDACDGSELCNLQGWCSTPVQIEGSETVPGQAPLTTDVLDMSVALADCWTRTKDSSRDTMCATLFIDSAVSSPLTESKLKSAYKSGDMDVLLSPTQNSSLHDLWGVGVFNRQEADVNAEPQPGADFEYCIWYDTYLEDELFVDKCSKFNP